MIARSAVLDTNPRFEHHENMSRQSEVESVSFMHKVAMLRRDFTMSIEDAPPGPPRRIDGYTIGAVTVTEGPIVSSRRNPTCTRRPVAANASTRPTHRLIGQTVLCETASPTGQNNSVT